MKTFLCLSFLVLFLCVCAPAQKSDTRCSRIRVETSPIAVIDGYPMIFTAHASGGRPSKLEYRWTITNGEILEGQGTREIKVDTLGYQGESIKATVTVTGLPKGCRTYAAATGFVKPKPYLN